jgi:alkanesulfonate monooxygenase SsuD/methylene tetrahydromethanopterin reductase-like flavin-dependent oxidoreductase (luciferase family)
VSEPRLSEKLGLFRQAAREAGTSGTLALMRVFHVARDQAEIEQAEMLARRHFGQKRAWGGERGLLDPGAGPDDVPALETIVGTPDACVAGIRRCLDTYRPDHLVLLMGFKGMPEAMLRASIALAGAAVLPEIAHRGD